MRQFTCVGRKMVRPFSTHPGSCSPYCLAWRFWSLHSVRGKIHKAVRWSSGDSQLYFMVLNIDIPSHGFYAKRFPSSHLSAPSLALWLSSFQLLYGFCCWLIPFAKSPCWFSLLSLTPLLIPSLHTSRLLFSPIPGVGFSDHSGGIIKKLGEGYTHSLPFLYHYRSFINKSRTSKLNKNLLEFRKIVQRVGGLSFMYPTWNHSLSFPELASINA